MKYFKIEEFNCKCCGKNEMDANFLAMLDFARALACVPFSITSGYRCEKHNLEVGSTSQNHTSGKAADISCPAGHMRYIMVKALIEAGFRRIGIRKDFIHVDSTEQASSIWLY